MNRKKHGDDNRSMGPERGYENCFVPGDVGINICGRSLGPNVSRSKRPITKYLMSEMTSSTM